MARIWDPGIFSPYCKEECLLKLLCMDLNFPINAKFATDVMDFENEIMGWKLARFGEEKAESGIDRLTKGCEVINRHRAR